LNRSAFGGLGLKGLPLKPDLLKGNKVVSSLDDSVETKRHLEVLGDMPAVDMTMEDGEAGIGDLEVDDDDEDANRIDAELKAKARAKAQAKAQNAMDVDDYDELDPLDAFMDGVKDEVKKVNAEDLQKMVGSGRLPDRGDDRMNEAGADDDDGEVEAEDELQPGRLGIDDLDAGRGLQRRVLLEGRLLDDVERQLLVRLKLGHAFLDHDAAVFRGCPNLRIRTADTEHLVTAFPGPLAGIADSVFTDNRRMFGTSDLQSAIKTLRD